jgi:hypothetical protein
MSSTCHLKNPAICDTLCQVTRGAEPRFADTPDAQWIKAQLEKRGWGKKDLAAALLEVADDDRLGKPGAEAAVRRATHGRQLTRPNRELIERVLGPFPKAHPEGVQAEVLRLTKDLRRLTRRVAALERQAPPGSERGGTGR